MNGLDLIKRTEEDTIFGFPTGTLFIEVTTEEHAELEKRLMALDIIIEKKVNINEFLICCGCFARDRSLKKYNDYVQTSPHYLGKREEMKLTQDEFDLLEKVLKWTNGKKKK